MGRRQGQVTKPSSGPKTSSKRLLRPALKRPVAPILPSLAGNQATNTALKSGSASGTEGHGGIAATGALPTGTWTPLQPLKPVAAPPFFTATSNRQQAPDPRFAGDLASPGAGQGFRFAKTSAPVTEEGLADWAMHQIAQGIPPDKVSLQLYASGELSGGSLDDRRDAKATVDRNLPQWLGKRQAVQEFQRVEHEDALKKQAEAAKREEGRRERREWLHGGGPDWDSPLKHPRDVHQDKDAATHFHTYDDQGEVQVLTYKDANVYGDDVKRQSEKLVSQCNSLVDEFALDYRLDQKNVRETMNEAAWYQKPGLWFVGLGYSMTAFEYGIQSALRCSRAVKQAQQAIATIDKGQGTPAGRELNEAKRLMFEAKHWLAKMRREKEGDDASRLATLQDVSKTGDYAAMAVPGAGGIGLRAVKNAAVRGATVHSDPKASFGVTDFLRETAGDVAGTYLPGPLKGASPSLGRSVAANLAGGQVGKAISAGDPAALLDVDVTDVAFAVGGAAHEKVSRRAGHEQSPAPADKPPIATGTKTAAAGETTTAPAAQPAAAVKAATTPAGKAATSPAAKPPAAAKADRPAPGVPKPQANKAPPKPPAKAKAKAGRTVRGGRDVFAEITTELDLEPPTPRTPSETGPRDPNDPHWDDYQKTQAKRGFENAPGVSQHPELQRQLGEIAKNSEPNTQRQKERLDGLRRDVARRQKEIKPLEKEVNRLRRQAKSKSKTPAAQAKRAEAQAKLAELEPKLQDARNQRNAVGKFITQTKNRSPAAAHERVRRKLALSRVEDFEPLNRPLKSRGADAGSFQDTHAVVKVIDSKTKRVVAWSIETFNGEEQVPKPENKLQAKKAREAGTDRQKHAEEKSLPNIEYQLRRRGIKSLKGYSIEVVGDREVCERVCQPALQEFASKRDADAVDGYTYHGTTARGRPLSEKTTAVKRSTDLAEGMTVTKQRLPIYRRPEGGPPPTPPSKLTPTFPHRAPIPQKDQDKEHPAQDVPRAADDTQGATTLPRASEQSNVVGEPPKDAPPATKAAKQNSKTVAADSDKVPASPNAATEPAADYTTPPGPVARKAAATSDDVGPHATKQSAKAAVPEHAQPTVRDPGAAPTKAKAPKLARPPSSRGEKVTGGLAKADTVLGAVRDYQQYKADGASDAEALTRSGTTLAANLKGGPAAAIVNSANAFDNARRSGQGKVEAMATAIGTGGGGIIASKVAPAGPVGTAVNLANTAAQALGAPQGVQDATTGAAALVPSNIVATTVTEGARSYANLGTALVTGDTKALDKQVQGFQAGSAGPWLQGYAQMTGMVADMAAGDKFETALNKAAAIGKGSWADRVGSKGGDGLYELGQSKEAKSGKYGASVQGISMALGITSDMIAGQSFEQALNKAAEAGKGSWPEKAGSALGDVAWDATEKTRQLVNEGLPAAKQAIKDKWHKLWS